MIWRVLILVSVFLPGLAAAQEVGVRSGEHAAFSRLLLQFDAASDWALGRVEGGYEFRPARDEVRYDLRRVFTLIPRDRIRAVENREGGRLFIDVACACHADAFALEDGQVVIDIKDGAPPPDAAFERAFAAEDAAPPARAEAVARLALPANALPARTAGAPTAAAGPNADSPFLVPRLDDGSGARVSPSAPPPRKPAPVVLTETISPPVPPGPPAAEAGLENLRAEEMREEILQTLSRAAAQGLLQTDITPPDPQARAEPPPGAGEVASDPARTEAPASPRAAEIRTTTARPQHLQVETGVDRALTAPAVRQTEAGEVCIDPETFDIPSWWAADSAGTGLGDHRRMLVGNADGIDVDGANRLVRYYIALGFGAEAAALIRAFPEVIDDAEVLGAMASIVDGRLPDNAAWARDQATCPGATSLWGLLAQGSPAGAGSVNASAVVLAFAALPDHLRRSLGPATAQRLASFGEEDAAEAVLRAAARVAAISGPTPDESRVDPGALIRQVNAAIAADAGVPDELVALLSSVAYEHRGTGLGGELAAAEIRALVARGAFPGALKRLDQVSAGQDLPAESLSEHTDHVFGALADDADDAVFLTSVLSRLGALESASADTRRLLAERLLSVGLHAQARTLLAANGSLPSKEDRLLLARVALQEAHPEIAVGYLVGLVGPAPARLRGMALARAGDLAGASRVLAEAGEIEASRRAAWRAGLWPEVASSGEGAMVAAAALAAEPTAPPALPDGPGTPGLAAVDALIAQSRNARDIFDALLSEMAVP